MYRKYRLTYILRSGDETFVVKRVPRQFYDLSQRLASEFESSSRLRVHTDCNHEENVLVFPFVKSTLLALIQGNPEFPTEGRKKALRQVGEAIQELHSKDWIHLGILPYFEGIACMFLKLTSMIRQMSSLTMSWSTPTPTKKGTRPSPMQSWATSISSSNRRTRSRATLRTP